MRRASDFRVGQRVKLSAYAISEGFRLQSRANNRGTVVRVGHPLSIFVRPDGYKTVHRYYSDFWEPIR